LKYLENLGFDAEWINHPVDIKAKKEGEIYWIEVKGTAVEENGKAFGAVTLTEWMCAEKNRKKFYFLIANKPGNLKENKDYKNLKSEWKFELVTPETMMAYSTVSPFHVKFHWPVNNPERTPPKRRSTTIVPTWKKLKNFQKAYENERN
jgi:hypothetical protein